MQRYKIKIEYEGTPFVGWQFQKNGKSIQEVLQKAIFKFSKEKVTVIGAGRTDSGVHALGQTAHFDLKKKISKTKINWNLDAHKVLAHIHGLSPSPGAWFEYENERYKVLKARIMTTKGKPSSVLDDNLTVGCKSDSIKILELQRQGKNKQTTKEFLLGKKIIKGSALN